MKIVLTLIGCAMGVLCVQQASAYIYSFSNHTNDPIKIRVQLDGVNEPWEEAYIEAQKGHDYNWTALGHSTPSLNIWKAGFCLKNIQVQYPLKKKVNIVTKDGEELGAIDEIIRDNNKNIVFGPWSNVVVEYIENEGVNAILNAAESFAANVQNTAKSLIEAVAN